MTASRRSSRSPKETRKKEAPFFIPYGRHTIEEDDIRAVAETLRSPFLTTGPRVGDFEKAVAARVGALAGVAMSSGTAALHAAMAALGLVPGDEVLVPGLSFAATANAVRYVGGTPVFVDCEKDGFNLCPEDAAQKITPRTKAIVPVHFAGQPVQLDAVHRLAHKHNLRVVEDAAHAFGAVYRGRPVGALSDMTMFSFHPVKHITTGEGGMITFTDPSWATPLRSFRHHGINIDVIQRDAQKKWEYDIPSLGFNYRLTDFQCALGLSQLKKADRFLKRREEIVDLYDRWLGGRRDVLLPPRASTGGRHSWHLYVLRLGDEFTPGSRDVLFQKLRDRGIGVQVHYKPIYRLTVYQKEQMGDRGCSRLEAMFPRMISIPLYPALTNAQVKRVAAVLNNTLDEVKRGPS